MASRHALTEGFAQTLESRTAKRPLSNLIMLVIVCMVLIPTAYFMGQSGGYNTGYTDGDNQGYYRGYASGWESGEFSFYYVEAEQKFGVYNLSSYVSSRIWPETYQEGVFDCSEMSAALERILENEGWHAIIAVGDFPVGSGKHSWLLVETSEGEYMPVESTSMDVVWWDNPYFDYYFAYEYRFETIQEALDYSESEFDWWKS